MGELVINNVNFSNINTTQSVGGKGGKYTRTSFVTNNKIDTTKITNVMTAVSNGNTQWSNMAFVNAIDIDWNGAQLGDKTLNTTGEVLSRYKVAI